MPGRSGDDLAVTSGQDLPARCLLSVCAGTPDCLPRTRPYRPLTAGPSRKRSGWARSASAYRITVCRVAGDQAGRVDSWIWSVRLARTRSAASVACRAGHVRVNGVRVKPAHAVRAGDEVRLRGEGRERVVVVRQVISKRVSPSAAAACYIDNSPPPPPREEAVPVAARDRGAGRPTKRERRSIDKLLGRPPAEPGLRVRCGNRAAAPGRCPRLRHDAPALSRRGRAVLRVLLPAEPWPAARGASS